MRASIQDLLKLRVRLDEISPIDVPCLVMYAEDDHIHPKRQALTIADTIPTAVKTLPFANFRAVHEPASADAVLNWCQTHTKTQLL